MRENMNMDYDVKLIDEVKKYPELYDSSHRNFKNKDIKAALWKDIAFKMRKQTDEYSVKVVRMRWKSLRDSYVKEIKYKMAVSTGHNVKPRKNWRYSNCMTFLAPYLAISFPLPPNKTEDTKPSKEELGEHEPEQSYCMNMNSSNEDASDGHFLGALLDFSKHDNSSEKGENFCKQEYVSSSTNTPCKSEGSDIDSFFKGISETVKRMNVVNQVFIQRNIVNMILDFKLREAQEKYIIQQRVADDND